MKTSIGPTVYASYRDPPALQIEIRNWFEGFEGEKSRPISCTSKNLVFEVNPSKIRNDATRTFTIKSVVYVTYVFQKGLN